MSNYNVMLLSISSDTHGLHESVGREVRDLIKNPPEGIRLVVDNETGMPASLGEVVVSLWHEA
jgi:hypothetical protein